MAKRERTLENIWRAMTAIPADAPSEGGHQQADRLLVELVGVLTRGQEDYPARLAREIAARYEDIDK